MRHEKPSKLFNKSYNLLIFVSLITSLGFSMISSLISSYAVNLGAGLSAAGVMVGIFLYQLYLYVPLADTQQIFLARETCVYFPQS